MNINQTFSVKSSVFFARFTYRVFLLCMVCIATSTSVFAQTAAERLAELRWKSESQVKLLLGEPSSVHGPKGTHASYVLWKYDNMTVAFSNGRVFHVFQPDSLRKIGLEENR